MSTDWRAKLAQAYIEWGNKFHFLRGDAIDELRRIKKKQDMDSQDTFLSTRPPDGNDIEYIYFRLFDIFQTEDTDYLIKGLRKLFPNFDNPFLHGDYHEKFIRNATGITEGEWLNIGYIYRERKGRLFADNSREYSRLPPQVDYVHIELHKILPSIFAVTYDVYLEECATIRLKELQCSSYKSEIRFRKIIPFGKVGGGYSFTNSESRMKREISYWLSNIRSQVEKCIEPFLGGDFIRDRSPKYSRLPSIEVFGFKRLPESRTDLLNWIQNSRRWLESFGFHI